jgi:ceramide glucosyltransferase
MKMNSRNLSLPLFVALACVALAGVGLLQSAVALLALRGFQRGRDAGPGTLPPVTVLKPLHGDEALLEEALASYCAQDYPAFQIVFGAQDAADPALAAVARLRARFPRADIAVVADPTRHGSNGKVGNLINMLPAARHEVLVIADSDIHAEPLYLRRVVAALQAQGVGLVTTLWAARSATDTLAGRLGAAYVNRDFLPGAVLARLLGRQDCLGATMALTRTTLERIGGLAALANHVADDALLGQLVRGQGLGVALARTVPATTVPETSVTELFRHELRWARTVRAVAPVGFALTCLQYPLFWAALAILVSGAAAWAWATFALAWLIRALLAHGLDRALRVASPLTIWCLPLRDLLSMAVLVASYGSDRVTWRGQEHRVTRLSPAGQGIEVR